MGVIAWPTTVQPLAEWVTFRAHGSPDEDKLSPDTLQSYLSALRSVHVDRRLPTTVFESEFVHRVLKGLRRSTPLHDKSRAAPITRPILEQILVHNAIDTDDINVNAAFTSAFSGFLRSGEFTQEDRLNKRTQAFTKLTRSDVHFAINDEYVLLRLKRSKTDILHRGVEITLAATGHNTCPVTALRMLFTVDPQPPSAPLFRLRNKAFSYSAMVTILRQRLRRAGIADPEAYRGHSFRRGAAQHASDIGLPQSDIQSLGRWTSEAFRVYYKTIHSQRFNLSLRFLTGTSPSLQF
jgi:integrase